MKIPRRRFLQLTGTAVAALARPQVTSAFDYPIRPVRVIVPYPPGGSNDILARLIGQGLSQRLGQQIFVENRPGGGSNIGTEAAKVVRAPPDRYTLLVSEDDEPTRDR
jgi:tripartite-type tricarboxylate transporter receptor subunit TctC